MTGTGTIAAVASGWGLSPCAIVRLSGPGVRALIEGDPTTGAPAIFENARLEPHAVQSARFVVSESPRRLTLPVLLMTFVGPRSYTGEDAAELLVPGSIVLLERVLARLASIPGVREAGPGEFSARAYLNGKLTLEQAEGVAALIGAQSESELAAARGLLEGRSGEMYRAWSDEVATLLALVEAGIDFTDQEDVVAIAPADLERRLEALIGEIGARLSAAGGTERPALLPRVVLAGAPNAGKSTLFNALLGRRRAVTSAQPGTTRDVLEEVLDLSGEAPGGGQVMLIDLAGLDEPRRADAAVASAQHHGALATIDAEAQHRAHREIASADVVVHCDPAGRFASDRVPSGGTGRVIRLRTKADLPGGGSGAGAGQVAVCALDGWNIGVLRRAIADAAWGGDTALRAGSDRHDAPAHAPEAFLLPRHRRALADAAARLHDAMQLAGADAPGRSLAEPELAAGALRAALDSLGELTGRITPDDVIGRVFATFCVGK